MDWLIQMEYFEQTLPWNVFEGAAQCPAFNWDKERDRLGREMELEEDETSYQKKRFYSNSEMGSG